MSIRLIAREMVTVHAIDPLKVVSEEDRPYISIDKKPTIFNTLHSFLEKVPEEYPNSQQNPR